MTNSGNDDRSTDEPAAPQRVAEHWHADVVTYPWFMGMTHPVWDQPQAQPRARYHVRGTQREELGDWMLREAETPASEQTRTVLFSMAATPDTVPTPCGTREAESLTVIGVSPQERARFVTLFGDLAARAHFVHLDVLHHPLSGVPNKGIRVSAVPGDEARCQPGICTAVGDIHTRDIHPGDPGEPADEGADSGNTIDNTIGR